MNISLSPSMPGEKEFAELKFFATCRGVQEQARPDREQLFLLIFSGKDIAFGQRYHEDWNDVCSPVMGKKCYR